MTARPRRLLTIALLAMAVLSLTGLACNRVAKPKGWAGPVVGDGLLLAAHKDKLYALDAATWAPKWRFPSAEQSDIKPIALYGEPAVAGGLIFLPTYRGILYALEASTGNVKWSADTKEPLIGGATVSGDTVYFGSANGKLYALDVASGDERWPPFRTDNAIWSTPAVVGGAVYVTSLDSHLYVLDAATGAERWKFKTKAGIASPPVVDEAAGLVYVGGYDSRLRAIDLEKHQERWALAGDNWFWTRPLVSNGVVYAGGLDSKVYAVNAQTGVRSWERPFGAGALVRAGAVLAGGSVVVVDKDGNVYALDPATGAAKGEPLVLDGDVLADPWLLSSSDANGGQVVMVTTAGNLVRIDPATLRVAEERKLSGS